jgi:hypothetical protein
LLPSVFHSRSRLGKALRQHEKALRQHEKAGRGTVFVLICRCRLQYGAVADRVCGPKAFGDCHIRAPLEHSVRLPRE